MSNQWRIWNCGNKMSATITEVEVTKAGEKSKNR